MDDNIFYTAESQVDDTCGDPFAPSDHFFDTAEYQDIGNTPVLPSSQNQLSLSGQTYYTWIKRNSNVAKSRLIPSVDSHNRQKIANTKCTIAYSSNMVNIANIALNEMDSHANTCCLGKNFTPLYYTGEVCNVHACYYNIAPIKDVRIGARETVWTD